jgi:hypothetical protein
MDGNGFEPDYLLCTMRASAPASGSGRAQAGAQLEALNVPVLRGGRTKGGDGTPCDAYVAGNLFQDGRPLR